MLALVLLVLLSAFAAACPPYFNDFTYLGNDTHTTTDLVRNVVNNNPQLGWDEIVSSTGAPLSTWPGGSIPFCFDRPSTREHLEADLQEAWNLWSNKLGPAGEQHGHKLQFYEYIFWPENWQYCYKERKSDNDPWEWNTNVPYGVAVILEAVVRVPGMNPSAVVGYIPPDWPNGPLAGRMGLRINQAQAGDYGTHQAWIAALAHELGHVFGLWHEHQRPDRDHYVRFFCPALPGYEAAKVNVDQAGVHTMDQVCADTLLAASYGFHDINDFDTTNHLDPASNVLGEKWYWIQNYPERDYDEASIMHYDSHAAHWNRDEEKMYVRLTLWYDRDPDFWPPAQFDKDDLEFVYTNFEPSDEDIKGIKWLYAWSNPN